VFSSDSAAGTISTVGEEPYYLPLLPDHYDRLTGQRREGAARADALGEYPYAVLARGQSGNTDHHHDDEGPSRRRQCVCM
jgi:hypothetical protein